jgi:hypothetical protein
VIVDSRVLRRRATKISRILATAIVVAQIVKWSICEELKWARVLTQRTRHMTRQATRPGLRLFWQATANNVCTESALAIEQNIAVVRSICHSGHVSNASASGLTNRWWR